MRFYVALCALALTACAKPPPFIVPSAPPCMPETAKAEIRTQCMEKQDGPYRWLLECPALGAWSQEYLRWRDGVYGKEICQTQALEQPSRWRWLLGD